MIDFLLRFLHATWDVLLDAGPAILLGTLFAGLLQTAFMGRDLPAWATRGSLGSVVRATIVGIPLPLCSCSVLPVAMDLRRRGASRGATSAFLIATPQTGVDSILLSVVMLNPVFAAARVIGAFVTGTVAGTLQNLAGGSEPATATPAAKPACGCHGGCGSAPPAPATPPGLLARLGLGQRYAFGDLLPSMTNFYVIGFLATGAILAWLPQGALEGIVGGGLAGMVAACALGTVLYLCASSATPLAAVLVAKGMSPGTALVLLLAGPATSLASMVAVRAMLGLRGLLLYLASIIACALVLGVALDAAAAWWSLPPFAEGLADGREAASLATQALTIALVGLFAWSYARRLWPGGGSGSHGHGHSRGESG